jgi:hypothetical protein
VAKSEPVRSLLQYDQNLRLLIAMERGRAEQAPKLRAVTVKSLCGGPSSPAISRSFIK